jgi:hypothetical protein
MNITDRTCSGRNNRIRSESSAINDVASPPPSPLTPRTRRLQQRARLVRIDESRTSRLIVSVSCLVVFLFPFRWTDASDAK